MSGTAAGAVTVSLSHSSTLTGSTEHARDSSKPIYSFRGLRYALPPVGDLRFKPPQHAPPPEGRIDATQFGAICPQNIKLARATYAPFPVPDKISEDCLFLNVYTPTLNTARKLPVMIWIHGGTFNTGFSNLYSGVALCTFHDVVVVTINYRVGPYGFMCTGDGVVEGNAGLLDQVMAFKWVKQNISCFGGDPGNVTLFGESAGGISISNHMVSPLSQGLFHKAICQSGVSTFPGALWTPESTAKFVKGRLKKKGCTDFTGRGMLSFMADKTWQELSNWFPMFANPTLDGVFFMDQPLTRMINKQMQRVPLLLGFNKHEGAGFVFDMARKQQLSGLGEARRVMETFIKRDHWHLHPRAAAILQSVTDHYLSDVEEKDKHKMTERTVKMYGDLLMVAPTIQVAELHSGIEKRTYMYKLDHRPTPSPHPDWITADHGNDIFFMFGEPYNDRFPDLWSPEEKILSQQMMAYWASFAKTGDPNSEDLPSWPSYTAGDGDYMLLKPHPTQQRNHEPKTTTFWNQVIPRIASSSSTSKY